MCRLLLFCVGPMSQSVSVGTLWCWTNELKCVGPMSSSVSVVTLLCWTNELKCVGCYSFVLDK